MYAMLTLDLERGIREEQRTAFNEEMKDRQWSKLPDVTTTWRAKFQDGVSHAGALITTKSDVEAAAKTAGIRQYHAYVHFGPEAPVPFKST